MLLCLRTVVFCKTQHNIQPNHINEEANNFHITFSLHTGKLRRAHFSINVTIESLLCLDRFLTFNSWTRNAYKEVILTLIQQLFKLIRQIKTGLCFWNRIHKKHVSIYTACCLTRQYKCLYRQYGNKVNDLTIVKLYKFRCRFTTGQRTDTGFADFSYSQWAILEENGGQL